jgi:chemotaxis protein CheX
MSLAQKNILLYTDDPSVFDFVSITLRPLVKNLVTAKNVSEAMKKIENQVFDCVVLRTQNATLTDKAGPFVWAGKQEKHKGTNWIVLGKGVEDENMLIQHKLLKFLTDPKDGASLIKVMEGLFYTPPTAKAGNAGIDVNFINPIVAALANVLETMGKVKTTRGTPFVKQPGQISKSQGDISGIIAMNSERFTGSLALLFEEKLITTVVANMLGKAPQGLDDDVRDCVGELTNIVFGQAKRDLNELGHTVGMAIPSVVTGKGHEVSHLVDGVCIVIPFEGENKGGKVLLETVLKAK